MNDHVRVRQLPLALNLKESIMQIIINVNTITYMQQVLYTKI